MLLYGLSALLCLLGPLAGSPDKAAQRVRLKNGVSVELLALTDEFQRQSWSTKDGSLLKGWVRSRPMSSAPKPTAGRTHDWRLVFLVSGDAPLMNDPRLLAELNPDSVMGGQMLDGSLPELEGRRHMFYSVSVIPDKANRADVTLRVAAGDWKPKASATFDNGVLKSSKGGLKPALSIETPRKLFPEDKVSPQVVARFEMPDGLVKYGFRFAAYDKQGKEIPQSGGGWRSDMKGEGAVWFKTDDVSRIARFEVQTRRFETAKFANVAVSPKG
jgi:hypothetical protein